MLFFEDLIRDKLSDSEFKAFFEKECHICANTVKLVAHFSEDSEGLNRILDAVGMSREEWQELRDGDCCNPQKVFDIYAEMGLDAENSYRDCPRLGKDSME